MGYEEEIKDEEYNAGGSEEEKEKDELEENLEEK
jgi:hypothetical protein